MARWRLTCNNSKSANMCALQGMSLVPAVTELLLAELMYLQYDNPTKPILMYINSAGVQVGSRISAHHLPTHLTSASQIVPRWSVIASFELQGIAWSSINQLNCIKDDGYPTERWLTTKLSSLKCFLAPHRPLFVRTDYAILESNTSLPIETAILN